MAEQRVMRGQNLRDRTFAFACRAIVSCKRWHRWSEPERTLTGQLARAGLSVGGQVEEAGGAQSRPDFLAKMSIALKEARESLFVLRVIQGSGLDDTEETRGLIQEADEIVSILTSSVKTTKANMNRS